MSIGWLQNNTNSRVSNTMPNEMSCSVLAKYDDLCVAHKHFHVLKDIEKY